MRGSFVPSRPGKAPALAEVLPTRKVFTLDRNDFSTYRLRRGHRHMAVEIVD